jgi:uncharacterized protein (DUF302 family)
LEEVKARVVEARKAQGFGILTEIDVQKTLKQKIDVDFKPYLILEACNPSLAYKALSTDESIGLLLPCNVVLKQEGNGVEVSILDPEVMFSVVEPDTKNALEELPEVAKSRLQAALKVLNNLALRIDGLFFPIIRRCMFEAVRI